jgi:type IV secretion system protein VirB5
MNIIKKAITLLSVFYVFPAFSSGIPVVDVAGNAQELLHWTEKVKQWGETVRHYETQINAYKDQLATATGVRNIGAFTSELMNLKSELQGIYNQGDSYLKNFSSNPTGALSTEAESLFKKYGAFNMCNTGVSQSDSLCKAKVVTMAANIEQGSEISKKLSDSMQQISRLSQRIEGAQDIKESQDLANSLQAQSLKMQAIKMQYDVWSSKNSADEKIAEAQQKASFRKQQAEGKIPTFN